MTNSNDTTIRTITVAGLAAGAIGIAIAKAGGMDMPPVPPGAVLLVVAAILLAVFRSARWPAFVAALVAVAEVVPSAITLGGLDGATQTVGSVLRFAGALTALASAVLLAVPGRARRQQETSGA